MYKRVLDIKPRHATTYPIYLLDRKKSMFRKPPVRTSTRALSYQSRKDLMNAVNWLVLFSPEQRFYDDLRRKWIKFRINFITLTLAETQSVDDSYLKNRLLQPFLKWLIRKGATAYIWKAETQNNGNLHFHITTNRYIHWREIRTKWNELQQDHGLLNDYQNEFGSYDPNSSDVHSVFKYADLINNIGSYFGKLDEWCHKKGDKIKADLIAHPSKWMDSCENEKSKFPVPKRQVQGRKWAVSNNLTHIRCFIDDEMLRGVDFDSEYNYFLNNVPHETMKTDFAEIYMYDENKLFTNLNPIIIDKLSDVYNDFIVNAPNA